MSRKIRQLKNWYESHERQVSSFSLLAGFVFDSLTLNRVDSLLDNLWLTINLVSICFCIILINREENIGSGKGGWKHFWLFNILQFSFGALLGASFIFYFRSAALAVGWPFLLMLLIAMIGNEIWKKHYERLVFQISFLYLSIFIFAIFLLPVLIHRVGTPVFLLSGGASLLVLWLFIRLLKKISREKFKQSGERIKVSVAAIFVLINVLYFSNLIPPIPLSLKDAGIYHSIALDSRGNYQVTTEKKAGLSEYFEWRQKVHLLSGEPLYAFAAVFAPGSLNTQIVHEWQSKNEYGKWVTATRIPLQLSGGRDNGFRTYSTKESLSAGAWRVNVETPRGALIGRINFEIIPTDKQPALVTSVKE